MDVDDFANENAFSLLKKLVEMHPEEPLQARLLLADTFKFLINKGIEHGKLTALKPLPVLSRVFFEPSAPQDGSMFLGFDQYGKFQGQAYFDAQENKYTWLLSTYSNESLTVSFYLPDFKLVK